MRRAMILAVIAALFVPPGARADDEDDPPAEPPKRVYRAPAEDDSWKQDVLVALIGGGVRFRRIHLDVGDRAGGTENRSFNTGAYFDFAWHLLIRPLGHRSPRASIRAMILQVDGGSGIGLTVEPEGTGIQLKTNSWRMVGQLGYLYPFERFQVGGLVGIGGDVFNIDSNFVLPSSRIVYVRFGPGAVYSIVPELLRIRGDFGLRFPFHLGELANAFGQDSFVFGLDSTVTLDGRIPAGFTYALRFVWEYYRMWFSGPTDDVPAAGNGGGGRDHAVAVQVLVGWSL